ncbi:MAG: glycosyltransferase family 1 protein, partial [Clostridiales bacterium]|nr:glycosyltransferase family 1 protein [Clostridiales bacterium]
ITNGIHTLTWLSPSFKSLYDRYLPEGWQENLYKPEVWEAVDNIPDEELWNTHCALKAKMIGFVRGKLHEQRAFNSESSDRLKDADCLLDSSILTIGFARRFATYKRANLIFRNVERIKRILGKPDMPVQLIFAGKAHPADRPAHEVIKNLNDISRQEGFTGKVILVENYNMTLSRNLVQGVDVWLNNPKRPLEASGTSGQKVCINGILNFSVLDGWWCEGYNGRNGWAIGSETFYNGDEAQDDADSESLYEQLENVIIPLFYERDGNNIPVRWVKYMKESIKSLAATFSTHRMLQDYTRTMYLPTIDRASRLSSDGYSGAISLAGWKQNLEAHWQNIRFHTDRPSNACCELQNCAGDNMSLCVDISLGSLQPSDVEVELYCGISEDGENIGTPVVKAMSCISDLGDGNYRFSADLLLTESGNYGYTFRVVPSHPLLGSRFDPGLVIWAV